MSGSIEALTAALEANTAAIEAMVKASGGKPGGAAPAKAAATKATAAKKTAPKGKTVEDIATAFGEYLGIKDADERETRKGHVKAIVSHFGASKATAIPPENFEEALTMLQAYVDGEDPLSDGEEEEEDGGALV